MQEETLKIILSIEYSNEQEDVKYQKLKDYVNTQQQKDEKFLLQIIQFASTFRELQKYQNSSLILAKLINKYFPESQHFIIKEFLPYNDSQKSGSRGYGARLSLNSSYPTPRNIQDKLQISESASKYILQLFEVFNIEMLHVFPQLVICIIEGLQQQEPIAIFYREIDQQLKTILQKCYKQQDSQSQSLYVNAISKIETFNIQQQLNQQEFAKEYLFQLMKFFLNFDKLYCQKFIPGLIKQILQKQIQGYSYHQDNQYIVLTNIELEMAKYFGNQSKLDEQLLKNILSGLLNHINDKFTLWITQYLIEIQIEEIVQQSLVQETCLNVNQFFEKYFNSLLYGALNYNNDILNNLLLLISKTINFQFLELQHILQLLENHSKYQVQWRQALLNIDLVSISKNEIIKILNSEQNTFVIDLLKKNKLSYDQIRYILSTLFSIENLQSQNYESFIKNIFQTFNEFEILIIMCEEINKIKIKQFRFELALFLFDLLFSSKNTFQNFRYELLNKIKYNNFDHYLKIYETFCNNPADSLVFCLFTEQYNSLLEIIYLIKEQYIISEQFQTRLTKSLKIIQSPIFYRVRLHLLETSNNCYYALYKLMMLIDVQSETFKILNTLLTSAYKKERLPEPQFNNLNYQHFHKDTYIFEQYFIKKLEQNQNIETQQHFIV